MGRYAFNVSIVHPYNILTCLANIFKLTDMVHKETFEAPFIKAALQASRDEIRQ
jgi:hypothetical protein